MCAAPMQRAGISTEVTRVTAMMASFLHSMDQVTDQFAKVLSTSLNFYFVLAQETFLQLAISLRRPFASATWNTSLFDFAL